MENAASRRNWIKKISTGIAGLVIAEHSHGKLKDIKETSVFNYSRALTDPKVVEDYKADALIHDKITSAFFVNVYSAGVYAIKHAGKLSMKTLAMHGTADRLTSLKGTEEFANNNSQNVELKLWDGFYHEIHNEPERQQVFDYIANWLSK